MNPRLLSRARFNRRLPDYESYILELHRRVVHDRNRSNKWWQDLPGFYAEGFDDVVHCLYRQVDDAQKSRERNEKERVRAAQKQQQEKRERINKHIQSDAQYLQECVQEYAIEISEYECGESEQKRLQSRTNAILESQENGYRLKVSSYVVSQQGEQLLRECSVEQYWFISCEGSVIQQQIHAEMITVLDQAAALRYQPLLNTPTTLFTNTIGQMAGVAVRYNADGLMRNAFTLADCCWALLDFTVGLVEGVPEGVYNTGLALAHPVDTVVGIAHGVTTAAWHVGKVLYEVCDIAVDCVQYPTVALQRIEDLDARIDHVVQALAQKIAQTPPRQLGKTVSANATEMLLTHKCLKCMHTFYQGAQQELVSMMQQIDQMLQPPLAFAGYPGLEVAVEGVDSLIAIAQAGGKIDKATYLLAMSRCVADKNKPETNKQVGENTANVREVSQVSGKTNKEIIKLAHDLGFEKTNYYSHGKPVFKKGNKFITIDVDSHNGGFWKMANSVENLSSKKTRLGTYDQFLNRIGD